MIRLPWVDEKKLRPVYLSKNPTAITYLNENPEMMDWIIFSKTIHAKEYVIVHYLNDEIFKVTMTTDNTIRRTDDLLAQVLKMNDIYSWKLVALNPHVLDLLENTNNLNELDWNILSSNVNAIPLLEKNLDKVN